MAETQAAPAAEDGNGKKTVVLVAVDDSDHSYRALEWAVRHVATAGVAAELVVVHAKPPASSVVSFGSPGAGHKPIHFIDWFRLFARGLSWSCLGIFSRRRGRGEGRGCGPAQEGRGRRRQGAPPLRRQLGAWSDRGDPRRAEIQGEPRYVLCDAVDKHHTDLLVVGSHGYGAIKRAFLGSVSDYCAHHAHCSVMIVKQPKSKK